MEESCRPSQFLIEKIRKTFSQLVLLVIFAFAGAITAKAGVTCGPYRFDLGDVADDTKAENARLFVNLSPNLPPGSRPKEISLADRVAYQRAIEEVYWRHRIWPEELSGPKPSLDDMTPPAQIEQKVLDYLRNSQLLADYWQQPVSARQLQAEMERMAQHTKQPEVLHELFEALGNDPFVIAECLARPALSDRLLRNVYAYDQRLHGELNQRAETDLRKHPTLQQIKQTSGTYSEIELVGSDNAREGAGHDVRMTSREWDENVQTLAAIFSNDRNESARPQHASGGRRPRIAQLKTGVLSSLQEDDSRYYTAVVVKKTKKRMKLAMVEWRKEPLESWRARAEIQPLKVMAVTGGNYTLPPILNSPNGCNDDTWVAATSLNIPTARESHTAVWTGSEMIIWGGYPGILTGINTGGRYNPLTGTWASTSTTNAPSERIQQTAVWTGSEMIVWGGFNLFGYFHTGGKYNPITDSWTATTEANAPVGRTRHTAVWTGSEMIVWGGFAGSGDFLNTGGRYNPSADTWTATSTASAPTGREAHTAVWTGSEMIVWGGYDVFPAGVSTGVRYNPFTNVWTPTSTVDAPAARSLHQAVWTGSEMIIWGGQDESFNNLNTGGRYDPNTNSWSAINTANAPSGRVYHTAVWSGSELIVWGGRSDLGGFVNTGGRYNPETNSWISTSLSNAAPSRWVHTAVWTGMEMIVWGGEGDSSTSGYLSTGGRYNPTTDMWAPTDNGPRARDLQTVVWTGSEMIIWGGLDGLVNLNTGGKYSPSTDSWTATSTANAPDARRFHTAVWTGTEMIVWGGFSEFLGPLNTGAKYNPDTNSWTVTSTDNAPLARSYHTAVWDGDEMIVWGGYDSSGVPFNTGGRYNAVTNSWTAPSTTNAPTARLRHTAVWTGDEMIIWGGTPDESNYLNTGGKYNSATDTWTTSSISNAPSGRYVHTAVWTGSEMIIWGGFDGGSDGTPDRFNTGGRYNPDTDSWATTSTTNAPSGRDSHTAVWTGSEMIVWGGENPFKWVNSGGRYDPGTDSWTATAITDSAPIGRHSHSGVWTGTEMIVWAGLGQFGFLNSGGIYCAQTAPPIPKPTPTPTPTPPLTPTPTPPPTPTPSASPTTLGNISTRLRVETGDNVLIGGFIVTGTQPKKIIVRAIGPSLPLAGALADPVLELRNSSGGLIRSNDNWREDPAQESEIIATGIPPANDLEAAIVETLSANGSAYTAIVRGLNNGTGIGLVEAYDLDQTANSRLANVSTRGFVQTGDDVLIGGLIVLGQDQLRVIVRALGPSLPFSGTLSDPTLSLHDSNGTLLISNNDWRDDPVQESEIIATGIPPTSDLESAIVQNLTPGSYTAIVRGVNNATGIAIVETYGLN